MASTFSKFKAKDPQVEENVSQLVVDTDLYRCVFETGEQISIKKSCIEKIPYFQHFFQFENNGGAHFKPPPKNLSGLYILPSEIEFRYLNPILAYLKSGKPLDLLRNLSENSSIWDLFALFDFLLMEKPEVGDLDWGWTKPGKISVTCKLTRWRTCLLTDREQECNPYDLISLRSINWSYEVL